MLVPIEDILQSKIRNILLEYRWIPQSALACQPRIVISPYLKEWGCCRLQDGAYTIELKEELVYQHAWYAVLDVLRHELAHFLVDILHPDCQEGPHGPTFRKICQKLGASYHASANYPPLDTALLMDDDSLEAKASPTSLKIKKLLALSTSPNEHEAKLALCKARELMLKYGVLDDQEEHDPFISVDIRHGSARKPAEEVFLTNFLEQFYGVFCIRDHELDVTTGETYVVTSVLGRRSKVKIALYVRDYVNRAILTGWTSYSMTHKGGVRAYRDYAIGFINGMTQALEQQEKLQDNTPWGLVPSQQKELHDFAHRRFPYMRTTYSGGRQTNRQSQQAGFQDGQATSIHDGIGDDAFHAPRQLPPRQ